LLVLVGQQEGQAVPGGDPKTTEQTRSTSSASHMLRSESVMSKRQNEQGRLGNDETLFPRCCVLASGLEEGPARPIHPHQLKHEIILLGSSATYMEYHPTKPGQGKKGRANAKDP
jgi:hypothetical protein